MKNKDHEVIELSENQQNPGLCDPRDFVVIEEGVPFHGNCGKTNAEYKKLLREGEDSANASDFTDDAEQRPDVNKAGKPRTP